MTDQIIETHPFPALLPPAATVMMMGTFPPTEDKRAMQFHYPNYQNDMWRIYGLIFFNDAAYFQRPSEKAFDAEKIKAFLRTKGIASCPTVLKAVREHGNASDKFLQVVETVDLAAVLASRAMECTVLQADKIPHKTANKIAFFIDCSLMVGALPLRTAGSEFIGDVSTQGCVL